MTWLLLPPIAAAIGWFTNFLAVRMIFRPRRARRFLGISFQGLLPKRRREFAENIGATVSEHLLSTDDLRAMLSTPEVRAKLEAVVKVRIDEFFDKKLAQKVPMLAGFLKGSLVDSIKSTLMAEMTTAMESLSETLGDELDEHLDLKAMVEQKILDFDFDQLEAIVLRVARNELRWIEILGAILGFMIGLLQLGLLKVSGGI